MIFADAQYDALYEGTPKISYMICGPRRTGTTHLCQLLWATNQLGKPFEYQLPENKGAILQRMPLGVSYWDFLRQQRTTPNGVFAFKEVAPGQYLARNLIPDKMIYITRRDEIAQAVSLMVANQTGAFFSFQEDKREPAYDYDAILNNMIHIQEVKRQWEEIFQKEDITPLRLVYEEINTDTLALIADFIGIDFDTSLVTTTAPRIKKQGGSVNKEWATRFRSEMEDNGCSVAA